MLGRLGAFQSLRESAATLRRLADAHRHALSPEMRRFACELQREAAALATELRTVGLLTEAANQNGDLPADPRG
jgi:hypothetical protein